MKKIITLLCTIFCVLSVFAQDIIITKDNEILYVNSKSNNHIRCRNINGNFVIINRLNIQTMLLSKYENRFSHDQSEFNLFEDCISHLNSTRVIGVGELQLYQQAILDKKLKKALLKLFREGNVDEGLQKIVDLMIENSTYNAHPKSGGR